MKTTVPGLARSNATLMGDVGAWALNVSTSVMIVFVNKVLMDPRHGHGFGFATSLCALHFAVSALAIKGTEWAGYSAPVKLPLKEVAWFSFIAGTSVASLNLSLLVNSVGFYQISKLLIIPFVCVVEAVWLKRRYTTAVLASMVVVVFGVGVVTVTDLSMNMTGFVVAMISVVTSGMQQIMCGTVQRKHNVTSTQLLSNTAPVQSFILFVVGPWVDKLVYGKWITGYQLTVPGLECLVVSCLVAVLVNISQFMCLGRFTALTFQVLGHTKTVLVLLAGWMYLHDAMPMHKVAGIMLAVLGMVAYGYNSSKQGPQQAAQQRPGVIPGVKEKSNGHVMLLGTNGLSGSSKDLAQTAILVEPADDSSVTSPGKVS